MPVKVDRQLAAALPAIFKGVLWFLAAEVVIMILLIAFPSLSTYLPNQLLYL